MTIIKIHEKKLLKFLLFLNHLSKKQVSYIGVFFILHDNVIVKNEAILYNYLIINQDRYLVAEFIVGNVVSQWKIIYSDNNTDSTTLSGEDKKKLCDYLKIKKHNTNAFSIKPSKLKTLVGKLFDLSMSDMHGEYEIN